MISCVYSKIGAWVEGWQLSKVIGILQALTCLIKLLVDLTSSPYLGHLYDQNSIIRIVNCKKG